MQINTYIKKPFDLTNIPLEGLNLIEASAGTGKTYNITKLIIRFLLDKKLSISDILVVTFTNAATYELQNRIINELYETNRIINNSENLQPESNVWHKYLSYLIKNNGIENLQKTIKKAINEFQNANIFTIHSFCNKLLKLYAFESSSPFNLNILKDSDKLFDKYYNDFKRIHFTNLEYFVYNLIHKFIDDDEIRKIVFFAGADFYRGKHNDKIEDIFEIINKKVEQIKTLLSKFPESGISSRKAKKTIPNQINEKYISPYNQPIDEKKYDKIKNELKKINDDKNINITDELIENQTAAELFILFLEITEHLLPKLKYSIFEFISKKINEELSQTAQISFDDMIKKLHQAVNTNENFVKIIQNKYKAVLVDEAQDTDKLQYEIFNKLFFSQKNCISFFIGDPKQSIYKFRGADIYSYLNAKFSASNIYTLSTNFRSDANFIDALNAIYSIDNPFYNDKIEYEKVSVNSNNKHIITIDNQQVKPLHLLINFTENQKDKDKNKDKDKYLSIKFLTHEILKYYKGIQNKTAFYNDKLLKLSDIAVLVKSNNEAEKIHSSLAKYNIKSIINSQLTIFDTNEAFNFTYILDAIIYNQNINKIKIALLCKYFPYDLDFVHNIEENSRELENIILKFRNLYTLWHRKGFIVMFEKLINDFNIIQNLPADCNKERIITNILQLGEILHKIEKENQFQPNDLLEYLQKRVFTQESLSEAKDEFLIRLESDEDSVKIFTIHRCKGLEFPIVFIPSSLELNTKIISNIYHLPKENSSQYETIVDFTNKQSDYAKVEDFQELLRLLYVAITRAKAVCYLYIPFKSKNDNKENDESQFDNAQEYVYSNILQKQEISNNPNINKVDLSDIKIYLSKSEEKFAQPEIFKLKEPLTFNKELKAYRKILSYSSIKHTADKVSDFDIYDYDFYKKVENDILPPGNITGLYIHKIFEDIFTQGFSHLDDIIKNAMLFYSIEEKFFDITKTIVNNTLNKKLEKHNNLILNNLDIANCIPEMEFYYPLSLKEKIPKIKQGNLSNLYEPFVENISQIDEKTLFGFMNGIIDLFFCFENKYYIIDWKTNYLDSYDSSSILDEMIANFYILQSYIYTLAVDRHLKVTIKDYDFDKHFGGIYYIFVRGIEPNSDNGIYFHKPSKDLIDLLNGKSE